MTSTKWLGFLLVLLLGLSLVMAATGQGQAPKRDKVRMYVVGPKGFLGAKGYVGHVARFGDRFVAWRFRDDERDGNEPNFLPSGNLLDVNDKYLGYDLRGNNKNVLVREARIPDDILWELVVGKIEGFGRQYRVENGELKGWWIGLGPLEPAEGANCWAKGSAPLGLVKEQKDAAGFHWNVTDRIDEGR